MKKDWILTQEAFDLLLGWLSPDKNESGAVYEQIRTGLIRLFLIRGCNNPESLADETINRVAFKLPSLINEYQGNPIHYFYGIANNIYLESRSPRQQKEAQLDIHSHVRSLVAQPTAEDNTSIRLDYLRNCLQSLSVDDRELITQYFAVEKSAKFEHRRRLGETRGLNLNSLRVKIVRLKRKLFACINEKMLVDQ